jgi:hypothetical protein
LGLVHSRRCRAGVAAMTPQTHRLTPLVKVPVFLLRDRDRELSEAYDEIERLHGDLASKDIRIAILEAELAELKGEKWARRDSVTY